MKQILLISTLFLLVQSVAAQKQQYLQADAPVYFNEVKEATKKSYKLWNMDLYGAILLVNPQTRQLFANEPDKAGILKPVGNVYSGVLPENVNYANTAIEWGGKTWAMIMLPLPQNKLDRINLLAHELFHKAQPSLGFTLNGADNNHLDQKDGRIYLRLELEALKKAVQSSSKKEMRQHLAAALSFRKYRHMLYAGSDTTENLLELNEGMAEYTGMMISGRTKKQTTKHFVRHINVFFSFPTFVRSFAYETIPIYGYLFYNNNKDWNKDIFANTDLTSYFAKAFNVTISDDLQRSVENLSKNYNGEVIIQEETAREEKTKKLVAEYKLKFIEQPHFEIPLENMNISFNPSNIMPVEDKGSVYPNMRITDRWGILTVENGALMSSSWNKISLTIPTKIEEGKIVGDGWKLELTEGYRIEKDEARGNYKLIKN